MNPICPRTRKQMAFVGFCMLLAAIAFLAHGYVRELNFDEARYYAPAISFVSHSWPGIPLRDYRFPGPPLARLAFSPINYAHRYSATLAARPWRASVFYSAVILLGVAYSIFKIRQPVS